MEHEFQEWCEIKKKISLYNLNKNKYMDICMKYESIE